MHAPPVLLRGVRSARVNRRDGQAFPACEPCFERSAPIDAADGRTRKAQNRGLNDSPGGKNKSPTQPGQSNGNIAPSRPPLSSIRLPSVL